VGLEKEGGVNRPVWCDEGFYLIAVPYCTLPSSDSSKSVALNTEKTTFLGLLHSPRLYYLVAVEDAFGGEIDYAVLIKLYAKTNKEGNEQERRYSPGECCGAIKAPVCGNPDDKHISTSYVERQNLKRSNECFDVVLIAIKWFAINLRVRIVDGV
jgi:hypothetical protein